jgi:GNAT superfamily N-acetyltransferase
MGEVLRDISAPALTVAIRANMREWLRTIGSSPEAELHEGPELTWLLSGMPTPTLNAVLRTEAEPGNLDALIESTLAHFRAKRVPRFCWWVGPDTQPADLGQRLAKHGLTYREGPAGMAVDLLALNEDCSGPASLAIEHVRDTKTLAAWIQVAFAGFGFPGTEASSGFGLFAGLGFDLPLRSYLGTLDGEPVAASQLFLGAGVAGIYIVATVPGARGRGIGTALTLAPLRDARDMGFRIGILHAAPMGMGLYRRLGFQEYCKMSNYLYQEDGPEEAGRPGRREE